MQLKNLHYTYLLLITLDQEFFFFNENVSAKKFFKEDIKFFNIKQALCKKHTLSSLLFFSFFC